MEWSERIGRRLKLRDLHILLTVAQCRSIAKAADQLAVSQPVVSKSIADLERMLKLRLIDRDRHGAEPTIYGEALLKRGLSRSTSFGRELRMSSFWSTPRWDGYGSELAPGWTRGSFPPLSTGCRADIQE